MLMDAEKLISLTEANQNFSIVTKKVDKKGAIIILKNNKPKYIIKNFEDNDIDLSEDEKIDIVAKRILNRYLNAFKELAK